MELRKEKANGVNKNIKYLPCSSIALANKMSLSDAQKLPDCFASLSYIALFKLKCRRTHQTCIKYIDTIESPLVYLQWLIYCSCSHVDIFIIHLKCILSKNSGMVSVVLLEGFMAAIHGKPTGYSAVKTPAQLSWWMLQGSMKGTARFIDPTIFLLLH